MERPFSARLHDAGVDEALQVMTERGCGQSDMGLDGPGGRSLGSGLHREAQDRQAATSRRRPAARRDGPTSTPRITSSFFAMPRQDTGSAKAMRLEQEDYFASAGGPFQRRPASYVVFAPRRATATNSAARAASVRKGIGCRIVL
jgi:hypothetical protein